LDEAVENGERIEIDDEKEEGADSLITDGSAGKKINCQNGTPRRLPVGLDGILN
jgi:hypothetical protein